MKTAFPTIGMSTELADDSEPLPHPGPLPLGEGESPFGFFDHRSLRLQCPRRQNCDGRFLSPAPSGRGSKGEGELLNFQRIPAFSTRSLRLFRLTNLGIRVLVLFLICAVSLSRAKAEAVNEAQLIGVLQSAATPAEKEAAWQGLKLIGTAKSVPAVAALLADEHLYQAACDVLETMPATEAADGLRTALKTTSGNSKAAVIHALGERRVLQAVSDLIKLLGDPDALVATSAAQALGRTGGNEAVRALREALTSAPETVRAAVVDALLQCAGQMVTGGDRDQAESIFRQLNQSTEKDYVRTAAFAGLIRASMPGQLGLLLKGINPPPPADEANRIAALSLARDDQSPGDIRWFTLLFSQESPAINAAVIGLLQQLDDPAAAPAVIAAAGSTNSYQRSTALAALGTLGDVTVIPLLANAATSHDEAEQKAARQALGQLRRGNVAEALVANLVSASDQMQVELIRALTARAEISAAPKLLEIARTDTGSARRAALRAMEHFADGSQLAALVQLLAQAKDEPARAEVRNVFEALADRAVEGGKLDVTPIVKGFTGADGPTRIALLQVSAFFADPGLRAVFSAAIKDPDAQVSNAAVRAICNTRDVELMPALLEQARNAGESSLRGLAFDGYVRLARDSELSKAPAPDRVALLKPALALATRPEEKRLVLAALAGVPHSEALALAEQACADAAVRAEAEIAWLQIAKALLASETALAEASLTRLATNASNQTVRTNAQVLVQRPESGWLCAGPYRQEGKSGRELFDVAFAPEKPGGGAVSWRGLPGVGDLTSVAAGDNCVVYLKTRVFLPSAQPVIFELGSDDGIKLWVNNAVTHANNVDRGMVPGQDKAKAQLRQGWNDLLAKITQDGGGCGMSLRITATNRAEILGLRFDPRGAQ